MIITVEINSVLLSNQRTCYVLQVTLMVQVIELFASAQMVLGVISQHLVRDNLFVNGMARKLAGLSEILWIDMIINSTWHFVFLLECGKIHSKNTETSIC